MGEMRVIDTHTHYANSRFDCNREVILESLPARGIPIVIEASIDFESNKKMLELCEKYPFVYAAVGVHPNCVKELDEEKFNEIIKMLNHEKVLAIGETGLDYSKTDDEDFFVLQKKWLRRFIKLAQDQKMPLVIHCREMKAYDDLIEILAEDHSENYQGIIHCFSGNAKHANILTKKGFFLGIGGKFLQKSKKQETLEAMEELKDVIKELELESIVLETDAPFLKPDDSYLGQDALQETKNTSLNLKYIVKELAKLKKIDEETIYETAWKNTLQLYPVLQKKEIL